MTIYWDAPVSPDDLTEIIRTNRTARYRSFDGRIHVSERDGGTNKWVNLAPLSTSLNKGELERLNIEFAKTGGTFKEALAAASYNDATNLTYEVLNRLNQAWGDVLVDGVLTIDEEGFGGIADYGVPGGHIVTAGTPWTTLSAAAIDNIVAWSDIYETTNGAPPEQIRTSRRVMRLLQQNTQFIGAIAGTTSGRTRVKLSEINDYLSGEGLPTIGAPIEDRVDVDGSNVRIVPDDRVFMLPADENMENLGYTAYGLSATALELVNSNESELSFSEAPGIVAIVEKVGPPYREFIFVDATAQPVLINAKLLFIADVA
jgi:hypothetical protein